MINSECLQVLELLWDLSHLPTLSRQLIELALEEHLAILSDSFSVREQIKRNYVIKCVEDIKKVSVRETFDENDYLIYVSVNIFAQLLYNILYVFSINRVPVFYLL